MSLTVGAGPFGHRPGGVFNFELPRRKGLIYFEDSPRRMRGRFGGEVVVDSASPKLLHEHGHLPIYYFPESDVRMDLLEATSHTTRCPWKGEASYWSVRVGERLSENAAWTYPDPLPEAPPLSGYIAFYWNKLDEWLEEDEPAIVHARDPYHRVDILESSRHVRVLVGGEQVAETRRPLALFETGLPTRWYFAPEDVREDLLVPSGKRTGCAYKGYASYWSMRVGNELEEDVVWFYPSPTRDAERIAGRLAFFNERVDIEVDGELHERPVTQWTPRGREPVAR
jgi:uncharacterized protein (DUF427 family)